jgi:hypothetical protein
VGTLRFAHPTNQTSVREGERLLEAHGIAGRIARRHLALDLVEPLLVIEQRDERISAVRTGDAELAAVIPVDPMLDIDLDLAGLGERL